MIINSFYNTKQFSLIQTLRIVRLARLTKEYFSLDKMITKLAASILSLGHVMILILMVFFVYAVIGIKMFGRVAQPPFGAGSTFGASNAIDTHANFGDLGSALLLLARITTGGDWTYIMISSSTFNPPPYFCDPQLGECGAASCRGSLLRYVHVPVDRCIVKFVYGCVIGWVRELWANSVIRKRSNALYQLWKTFDPDETMTISPFDVLPLIRGLPECVLGFNGKAKRKRIAMEINFLSSSNWST